ncbi:MAG TPA: UPF0280 family protein [Terriglobales bacterium]|jgi:hypothetical protein
MRVPPQVRWLPDGKRLHLNDGPIDLIVEAFGDKNQIHTAYRAAVDRFVTVLDELCAELTLLRKPALLDSAPPSGRVALRMVNAVAPFAKRCFVTPMAAVAGAVAEEILEAMTSVAHLDRAYVNDGGDIAFHLGDGQQLVAGMIERPDCPSLLGTVTLRFDQPSRGLATSGWRGRSFSLGIADAVTVLAKSASLADAAATVVANAVNLPEHPGIVRQPACELAPDNDLGNIPVTRFVGELTEGEIGKALDSGALVAEELLAEDLISSAALSLQGHLRIVGSQKDHLVQSESRSLVHA